MKKGKAVGLCFQLPLICPLLFSGSIFCQWMKPVNSCAEGTEGNKTRSDLVHPSKPCWPGGFGRGVKLWLMDWQLTNCVFQHAASWFLLSPQTCMHAASDWTSTVLYDGALEEGHMKLKDKSHKWQGHLIQLTGGASELARLRCQVLCHLKRQLEKIQGEDPNQIRGQLQQIQYRDRLTSVR
jgi:hypothetical protein